MSDGANVYVEDKSVDQSKLNRIFGPESSPGRLSSVIDFKFRGTGENFHQNREQSVGDHSLAQGLGLSSQIYNNQNFGIGGATSSLEVKRDRKYSAKKSSENQTARTNFEINPVATDEKLDGAKMIPSSASKF